ncbi:MAG: caspase family protein [Alphaproteobacteria bacterium]|nr:caspase family protein [Alphaproteobacteria bacterium]
MDNDRNPVFPGARTALARRLVPLLAATMVVLSLAATPRPAWAEQNIALVIGNSNYRKVPKLPNPTNDAADMAASLQRLGFTVTQLSDLDYNGFRNALIDFGKAAKTADKAVIFYAGHGMEIDGKNWLIPVDAELLSEINVYAEAINLETLIDISVLPKVIGLVVLDACRDNPFSALPGAHQRSLAVPIRRGTRPSEVSNPAPSSAPLPGKGSRGLAAVAVSDNVMVGFAAAAGTTAQDGVGRNSPYSDALLHHVETPKLEVNYLFRKVHDDVLRKTRTQEPAVYGSLSSLEVFLSGPPIAAEDASADGERVAWAYVRTTNEVTTLRRFVDQFPAGPHRTSARARIAQIEDAEARAWSIAERQKSAAAYRGFLDLYPYSEHGENARVTLASLEKPKKPATAALSLPTPPPAAADGADEQAARTPQGVEQAWEVLRQSRDPAMVGRFAARYPSQRQHRLPPGSDLALRRVNPTELMLRTAGDEDVDSCFRGEARRCNDALARFPDFVQLRFQLCRLSTNPARCLKKAVDAARKSGLLVSAYTRSEREKVRNAAYRLAVNRVQDNIDSVVRDNVSRAVATSVSHSTAAAASSAAGAAASGAASRAAAAASSGAAARAASGATSLATSQAASQAAAKAASDAAARAAAAAASGAASRISSDRRLKRDITEVGTTDPGLPLYRYRYSGDHVYYVGVMAQDVQTHFPPAVRRGDNGYLEVDYGLLGLKFMTWSQWLRRHPAHPQR